MIEDDKNPLSPTEVRNVFGRNLRYLASSYPSVTALCVELGINRTQFNRYLTGESFPRPDVLDRICRFFGVDARILLTPLDQLEQPENSPLAHWFMRDWLDPEATFVPEKLLPTGFYRFSRRSLTDDRKFLQGVVQVCRHDGHAFLRGLEPRAAMHQQGLPASRAEREYRGMILRQDDGVSIILTRRGGRTGSYNFLAPVASYNNNFWEGFVTRTIREQVTGQRMSRMVYEYLGHDLGTVLRAARCGGFCDADALLTHHLRLLQIDHPLI